MLNSNSRFLCETSGLLNSIEITPQHWYRTELKMLSLHVKRPGTGGMKMDMKKKQGRFKMDSYVSKYYGQKMSGLTPLDLSSSS